jgi:imidazolonepropionase-like amidohydrolase
VTGGPGTAGLPPGTGAGRPRVIMAGRVLLGDGRAVDDAAVVITRGRIAWVGPEREAGSAARAGAERFPGGCLVPGFIDAHVHLCFRYGADLTAPPDEARLAAAVALGCRRLIEAGVTSVRDLGSAGRAVQQARDAIARGQSRGPRIRCSGRPVTTPGGHLRSFGLAASGEAGVAAAVAAVAGDGADTVKIVATGGAGTPGTPLGRAQFTTAELSAAVRAAAGRGLTVAAHAHGTEGIERAVAAGVHTVEHCSWMTPSGDVGRPDAAVLAEMRRRRQIAVVAGPLPRTPAQRERTRAIWSNARLAREHGVTQALGSDSMFGQFRDHHDLAWRAQGLVELAGWPESLVLEALWQGGAAALGSPGTLGVVASGAHADLVVLGGDPRAGIRALHDVRAVFLGGRRAA